MGGFVQKQPAGSVTKSVAVSVLVQIVEAIVYIFVEPVEVVILGAGYVVAVNIFEDVAVGV